jgi:hypothetical protein
MGEVIKMKNEEMQLFRDCMSKISNLIQKYETGARNSESTGFSYFD